MFGFADFDDPVHWVTCLAGGSPQAGHVEDAGTNKRPH